MKKKILSIILCMSMISTALTGCGTKDVDATNEKEMQEESGLSKKTNSKKSATYYEAYQEFYDEFYKEHMSNDTEYTIADCGGVILLDVNENPVMAICDLTSWTDAGLSADIYLYEYDGREVVEKTKKTGILCSDDGIRLSSTSDGSIVMHVIAFEGDDMMYRLENDAFVSIPSEDDDLFIDVGSWYPLFSDSLTENESKYAVHGSDFDTLLSQLSEENPKTLLGLRLAYADFYNQEGYCSEPNFYYTVDGRCYIYSYSGQEFYLYREVNGNTSIDIPSEIEGIKVNILPDYFQYGLRRLERADKEDVGDITGFELKDDILYIDTKTGVHLEVPTTEAAQDRLSIQDLPVVKAEEEKGAEAAADTEESDEISDPEREYDNSYWRINAHSRDSGHCKYVSSYEEIKQFIEAGAFSDIEFAFGNYLYQVTLYMEEDDYYSLKADGEQWKQLYIKAMDTEEFAYGHQYTGFALADINGDGVPELICNCWDNDSEIYILNDNNELESILLCTSDVLISGDLVCSREKYNAYVYRLNSDNSVETLFFADRDDGGTYYYNDETFKGDDIIIKAGEVVGTDFTKVSPPAYINDIDTFKSVISAY